MFSPKYNKLVFIDFGLSQCLIQNAGELTRTPFFGSYYYTIKEMKNIFSNKNIGFVDLYYNDVHALNFTKNKKEQRQLQYNKEDYCLKKNSQVFQNHLFNIYLQFLIFERNLNEI